MPIDARVHDKLAIEARRAVVSIEIHFAVAVLNNRAVNVAEYVVVGADESVVRIGFPGGNVQSEGAQSENEIRGVRERCTCA